MLGRIRRRKPQSEGISMKMQGIRGSTKKWGVNIKVGRSKQAIIGDIQVD